LTDCVAGGTTLARGTDMVAGRGLDRRICRPMSASPRRDERGAEREQKQATAHDGGIIYNELYNVKTNVKATAGNDGHRVIARVMTVVAGSACAIRRRGQHVLDTPRTKQYGIQRGWF